MTDKYKDWIVRYYADHDDIPEGLSDGHIVRELVRCKGCIKKPICTLYLETNDDYGYCAWAERKAE